MLKKLFFIKHLFEGMSVERAAGLVGTSKVLGYIWLDRWNESGYQGLVPRYGKGRPAKLTGEQKTELLVFLNERDDWTLGEIRDLIQEEFCVEYSESWLRQILKSLGMKHAKPYMQDYRQPADAKEVLKKMSAGLWKAGKTS